MRKIHRKVKNIELTMKICANLSENRVVSCTEAFGSFPSYSFVGTSFIDYLEMTLSKCRELLSAQSLRSSSKMKKNHATTNYQSWNQILREHQRLPNKWKTRIREILLKKRNWSHPCQDGAATNNTENGEKWRRRVWNAQKIITKIWYHQRFILWCNKSKLHRKSIFTWNSKTHPEKR